MLPDNATEQARQRRRQNSLSRDKVKQQTRDEIATAIAAVDDPDARRALSLMFEVLTGDEPGSNGRGNN